MRLFSVPIVHKCLKIEWIIFEYYPTGGAVVIGNWVHTIPMLLKSAVVFASSATDDADSLLCVHFDQVNFEALFEHQILYNNSESLNDGQLLS